MPLQKLQFRPGVNREGTSLSNEGGWFDCDKIRFRSGYPEKIGGWAALSYNTFLGVCRSLWNWVTLKQYNLLGVGTNLKFYVEDGGEYYDITPLRETNTNPAGEITLDITSGSNILTITDTVESAVIPDAIQIIKDDVAIHDSRVLGAIVPPYLRETLIGASVELRLLIPVNVIKDKLTYRAGQRLNPA